MEGVPPPDCQDPPFEGLDVYHHPTVADRVVSLIVAGANEAVSTLTPLFQPSSGVIKCDLFRLTSVGFAIPSGVTG